MKVMEKTLSVNRLGAHIALLTLPALFFGVSELGDKLCL
jgi:hypothetical protein